MHDRDHEIYETIQKKLKRGSANKEAFSWTGVKERIEFIDRAKVIITDYLIKNGFPMSSSGNIEIANIYLLALLSESLECGNCGETAAVTLIEYLKSKYPGSAEIILLLSSNSILALDHFLVSVDRDPSIPLLEIGNWKGKIIDYWAEIKYAFGHSKEDIRDLIYDILGKRDGIIVQSVYRIDNCAHFYEQNKNYIIKLLLELKKFFNSSDCKELLGKKATKWLDISFDEFRLTIKKLITKELKIYKPDQFLIKHWEKEHNYSLDPSDHRPPTNRKF